ncbi:MAG: right-handed parallel beta-helix repeat-containing protein [Clostridiales bacterium]|nr:right-handed parallel beta-helix repeat-containing protein [Clostridiales bacterium]
MFSVIIKRIIAFFLCITNFFAVLGGKRTYVASPVFDQTAIENEKNTVDNASFYVSVNGDDTASGRKDTPFKTLERAKEAVRELDKTGLNSVTVAVMAGEYRQNQLTFKREDSGTEECPVTYCAYGDGEVILNGGVSFKSSDFGKVTDSNILKRLNADISKSVVCLDLGSYGITKEQIGKIYAIGSYNTAAKYSGDTTGPLYCELFVNDERQTLARYPDRGFLETGNVVSQGQACEDDNHQPIPGWDSLVNPEADVYSVDKDLANRIGSWQTLDDVWMFGFFKYDWADSSTPLAAFDHENKTITPKYVSRFGAKEGAPYYFFNILEELDKPGEFYIDRENSILYLLPGDNFDTSDIDLSLTTNNIINCNASFITFDGFTVKGTRSDAIKINGDNVTVKNCVIKNVAGNAVVAKGTNNTVSRCEITRTGKGGIILDGGDRQTLTAGSNIADNNLIHDWSEIYLTYQPAVTLNGVGNICSHNEIFNSPHEAVTYSGNNHIIEYNIIHDVCLLSSDAGAIYSGRHWDWYGNIIRYNCIYNLGSGEFEPDGIYLDDALSGQTIYGNLLINIPKNGIHIGGGRDNTVTNNIIINDNKNSIYADSRAKDCIYEGWFYPHSGENGDMWQWLYASPWQSEIWQNEYPEMRDFTDDFSKSGSYNFCPNPANNNVTSNIIVNSFGNIGNINNTFNSYSVVINNAVYRLSALSKLFRNPDEGDYSLKENSAVFKKLPAFEDLPLSEMGRYG